jgi:large subunit ribosomal protein L31
LKTQSQKRLTIGQLSGIIYQVMKTAIHPEVFETKVHCNSCGTDFVTHTTVPSITVDICSECHPFYTGKQKLIDTANRVAKFEARRAAKAAHDEKNAAVVNKKEDPKLAKVQAELESETVDVKPEA